MSNFYYYSQKFTNGRLQVERFQHIPTAANNNNNTNTEACCFIYCAQVRKQTRRF